MNKSFEGPDSYNQDQRGSEEELDNRPASELSVEELEEILRKKRGQDENSSKDETKRTNEQRESDKLSRREKILKDLGDNLTAEYHGERSGERAVIYRDGQYVGEVVADNNLGGLTDEELQDKVYDLLYSKTDLEKMQIGADKDAEEVMANYNVILEGGKLILPDGSIDLYNNGENESVRLEKVDDEKIRLVLTEVNGKIIEYIIDRGVFLFDSRRVRAPK